jgi:hypothetical protein
MRSEEGHREPATIAIARAGGAAKAGSPNHPPVDAQRGAGIYD